jgi:hypothetical protein
MPASLAQTFDFLMWTSASLVSAIGAAIAIFELVYAFNFSSLFAWRPEQVGRLTFVVLTISCAVPHLIIEINSIWWMAGCCSTPATAFLSGQPYHNVGLTLMMLPTVILTILCDILLIVSYIIIPHCLSMVRPVTTNQEPAGCRPQRSLRFITKRVAFAVFAFGVILVVLIVSELRSSATNAPLQGHVVTFLLTFILLLLLLSDKDSFMSARRQLWQQQRVVDGLSQTCCSNQTRVFVISSATVNSTL